MAKNFYKEHTFKDARILPIIDLLLKVLALKMLMSDSQGLYECGFFCRGSSLLMRESFKSLLVKLRPHMIPLAEGFPQFSSDIIYSSIGNMWGDINEAQLDFAKNSRLNKNQVPPYYETLMKPVMTLRKPKL